MPSRISKASSVSNLYTSITAELLKGFQTQVTIRRSEGGQGDGPWSIIVDEGPAVGGTGTGPSPGPLALAGLAA